MIVALTALLMQLALQLYTSAFHQFWPCGAGGMKGQI